MTQTRLASYPSYAINAQTGTTYTFVTTDRYKLVTFSNAANIYVTIDTNANVPFPIGIQIDCVQISTGPVTFVPAGGVTLNSETSNRTISAQWVGVSLIKTDTNTWLLIGHLTSAPFTTTTTTTSS